MISIIYPTHIKKYKGGVCKYNRRWRGKIEFKHYKYYKYFKTKEEGEEHIIEKNFEWDLPIKNIIYDHGGDYLEMELTQGITTIFSRQDLELVQKYNWCNLNGYASGRVDGIDTTLHNYLMNFKPTRYLSIDHINIDPLDNTRENLRIASRSTQSKNQGIKKSNTSGRTGVCLQKNSWLTRWKEEENAKRKSKSFSIKKYGEREAFKMACDYRKEMELKYY